MFRVANVSISLFAFGLLQNDAYEAGGPPNLMNIYVDAIFVDGEDLHRVIIKFIYKKIFSNALQDIGIVLRVYISVKIICLELFFLILIFSETGPAVLSTPRDQWGLTQIEFLGIMASNTAKN